MASPTGGLTLADQNYDLPFLWAANHTDGTVSKIDTRNMREVGRYWVCGAQGAGTTTGPSRTAVDLAGNAFVACRVNGHVTKIGVIEPECVDKNGDLVIQTSRDVNDNGLIDGGELLPWGTDECILWDVKPYGGACDGTNICGRAAGVDVNNDVWIGNWVNSTLYRLDGATGATKKTIALPNRPYGLAIAEDGYVWVVSRDNTSTTLGAVMRVNPQDVAAGTGVEYWRGGSGNFSGTLTDMYGIAIDPWGKLWLGQYAAGGLKRFTRNADGTGTFSGPYGSNYTRGVGIKVNYDTAGNVLGAEVYSGHQGPACYSTVSYAKLDANGDVVASGDLTVPGASGPVGNAIDVDGNQWAVSYCGTPGSATRYLVTWNGNTPTVNVANAAAVGPNSHNPLPIGTNPYSYSDMTGQALRNLAGVDGHYRHRWTGWTTGDTWWKSMTLDANLPGGPTVTWLEVRWRSADTTADLDNNVVPWTMATAVDNTTTMPIELSPDGTARRIGHYFELEIVFRTTDPGGQVPELNGIGLAVYHL